MKAPPRMWYRFGPYRLCQPEGILLREGESISLSPRAFDILALLVEKSPNLVTVEELIAAVWNNVNVEPSNVTQHVFALRKTLGDNSQNPTYIQNVPRRGYRFIAAVASFEETPPAPAKKRRNPWLIPIAAAVVVSAPLAAFLPVATPELRITGYHQLTHDGGQKDGPLLIHGQQVIYRSTEAPARMWAVPLHGGEAVSLGRDGEVESDISADGQTLLFSSLDSNGGTLWSRKVSGGEPKMLTAADTGSWSPDGTKLATADAGTLSIFENSKLAAKILVPGQAWNPRWSPDGSRIRFSVVRENESTLWEVSADGHGPHQIMESAVSPVVRDGVWNPAGNLFFFTAHTSGADNIWAVRERGMGRFKEDSKPVALTNGPGDWRWPVVSADSKQIFAIHSVSEPQLTGLDPATKEWRPFWHGAPIYEMDYSPNGQNVAFIQFPDHTLWRAKADGSERVQLTHEDLEAYEPHWSPEGKRIAFMSRRTGGEWRAAIIPANGGTIEDVAPYGIGQGVPTWAPDGKAVIFGDRPAGKPGPRMNVHSVDIATHKISDIPNSYGLWSPRFSPDGKYIAAPSFDNENLALLQWHGSEWKNVLRLRAIENVMWSADSRYIYFKGRKAVDCWELYRLRVADKTLEMVTDLKDFRWPEESWFGLTPAGTPLALYESSPQELFAIDYEVH